MVKVFWSYLGGGSSFQEAPTPRPISRPGKIFQQVPIRLSPVIRGMAFEACRPSIESDDRACIPMVVLGRATMVETLTCLLRSVNYH